jgi:hypothetical protein
MRPGRVGQRHLRWPSSEEKANQGWLALLMAWILTRLYSAAGGQMGFDIKARHFSLRLKHISHPLSCEWLLPSLAFVSSGETKNLIPWHQLKYKNRSEITCGATVLHGFVDEHSLESCAAQSTPGEHNTCSRVLCGPCPGGYFACERKGQKIRAKVAAY